jgi:surfeit locus 1 family protein
VLALVTVAFVALFVAAGNWQRARLAQKLALADQLERARASAPAPLPVQPGDWGSWRYRVVELGGRFDARGQMLLDNRVESGRVGYHVLTPLVLADGRTILVNRGFAPGGARRSDLPLAPPPAGPVSLQGRVVLPSAHYVELGRAPAMDAQAFAVWQVIDLERMGTAIGRPLVPVVVEQTSPADDSLVRRWPAPDTGADKHRIYMVQWYTFAALAAGLYVAFGVRRWWTRR